MTELLEHVLQANIYLQPVQFLLSTITNLLNICILSSDKLHRSPCTHYFRAYAIFSIIYTCLVCPTQFLRGFHIDWASGSIGCKLHFYFLFLIPCQANLMLILASLDRYCSSMKLSRMYSKTAIRTARINIILSTILSTIYMSPMLIIYKWNKNDYKCLSEVNTIISIYIFTQMLLYYFLAPIVMFTFGLLTISNISQYSVRAKLSIVSMRRRQTERQLTLMLLVQISLHIILIFPFGIIYFIHSLIPSTRTPNVLAIRYILVMWQQLDYFISFFLYILTGRVYRQELIRLLQTACFDNRQRHLYPVFSNTLPENL
ncbi:hypothetical protein I4U23_019779 [Adineta vaga]|nr:hypothetical protein I4U23_019779 [Adineta vaga]